jgi:hypothetical protein
MNELETRTVGKVMWRLLPFLIVCYFVAFLDRVNVSCNRSPPPPDQGGVSDRLGYRQPERGRGRRWDETIGLPVAGADGLSSFGGSRIVRQADRGGAPEPV